MRIVVKGHYELNGEAHSCSISRDDHGKWFVKIDGKIVHRRMNAAWMICWFSGVFFTDVKFPKPRRTSRGITIEDYIGWSVK